MEFKALTNEQVRIITSKAKPEPKFFTEKLFTRTHLSKTDDVLIEALPDGGRKLAPRVHPLMPGRPVSGTGSEVSRFRPTYLKFNTPVDPSGIYEISDVDPFSVLHNEDPMRRHADARAAIIRKHSESIYRTWEFMGAMAAINGYVDTEYLGAPAERVVFGRDAGLTFVNAAGAYWDAAGADILGDVRRFKRAMSDVDGGGTAKIMLVGSKVAEVVMKSAFDGQLKNLMDTRYGTDGTKLVRGLKDDEPISYIGSISGLIDIYEYTATFEDTDNAGNDVTVKPLGDNEIAMFAADIGGVKAFGRIKDLAADYANVPIFGRNIVNMNTDPATESVTHQSAPILVPAYPNRTLKATVLAA